MVVSQYQRVARVCRVVWWASKYLSGTSEARACRRLLLPRPSSCWLPQASRQVLSSVKVKGDHKQRSSHSEGSRHISAYNNSSSNRGKYTLNLRILQPTTE
jgi:hypothetical protein